MQEKSKFAELYETPTFFSRVILYVKHHIRMLLWKILDTLETRKTKASRSFSLDPNIYKSFEEDGYLHLPGFFPSEYIDEINASISTSRGNLERNRKNNNLRSGRIANIHSINRDVFKFLNDPLLQDIQKILLSNDPVLWGSLAFNVGTQQLAHVDAPFFYVEPHGSMMGMWIALEDINPDAGPLFYIPSSHLNQFHVKDVLDKNALLKNEVDKFRKLNISASPQTYWDLSKSVSDTYSKGIEDAALGERVTISPKKGDIFFWHQWLVHGGSPINNPSLTRKSIVSHWISNKSTAFDQHNFFLNYNRLDSRFEQKLPIKKSKVGRFIKQYRAQILNWD